VAGYIKADQESEPPGQLLKVKFQAFISFRIMKIAVFGDIHGHWRDFRDTVAALHSQALLDLVLQCGDAQSIRNEEDLEYMHCPKKYRELGDFWLFHEGAEKFPVPLLFIGGNHEPWNFLDQNWEGGILAPNIEFMGRVGMREIMETRIVGMSGVYSPKHFNAPHSKWPYPMSMRKQASYFNSDDFEKVLEFGKADILLLHEWPSFMNGARNKEWPSHWGTVGSELLTELVELLSPKYVFCGHMHAAARYQNGRTGIVCLSDFHRDPVNSFVVLDTSTWNCEWPAKDNRKPYFTAAK